MFKWLVFMWGSDGIIAGLAILFSFQVWVVSWLLPPALVYIVVVSYLGTIFQGGKLVAAPCLVLTCAIVNFIFAAHLTLLSSFRQNFNG